MSLADLRAPPGNRLEALSGNREGRRRILINELWRLSFVVGNDGAADVEISKHFEQRAREDQVRLSAPEGDSITIQTRMTMT